MTQYDTKVPVNDIYVRDDKKRNKLFTEKKDFFGKILAQFSFNVKTSDFS